MIGASDGNSIFLSCNIISNYDCGQIASVGNETLKLPNKIGLDRKAKQANVSLS